jgi:hypothetical protein
MSVPDVPNNAPHANRVAQLRLAVVQAVSPDDITAVVGKLIELAKEGDLRAIRLLLQYTLGKPTSAVPAEGLPASPATPHAPAPDPVLGAVEKLLAEDRGADGDLGEAVRRLLAEERNGAVTKREKTAARGPIRADQGHGLARTEAMRLVSQP